MWIWRWIWTVWKKLGKGFVDWVEEGSILIAQIRWSERKKLQLMWSEVERSYDPQMKQSFTSSTVLLEGRLRIFWTKPHDFGDYRLNADRNGYASDQSDSGSEGRNSEFASNRGSLKHKNAERESKQCDLQQDQQKGDRQLWLLF